MKARRLTNPRVQEYDRERYHRDPERRRRTAASAVRWAKENPVAYHALNVFHGMLHRGKVTRGACALCGATEHVHGHHKDYSRGVALRAVPSAASRLVP
jgi:hypothetical protein